MDQGSGVECLTGLFVGQLLGRQLAQLIIDQRQKLFGGVGVALFDRAQGLGDLAHDPEDNRGHAARQMNSSAASHTKKGVRYLFRPAFSSMNVAEIGVRGTWDLFYFYFA